MKQKNLKKETAVNLNFWLILVLVIVTLVSLLAGLLIAQKINNLLNKKIAETEEAARPANLELVILKESTCQDCFNLSSLIEIIKKANVKINSEKTLEINSQEGKELINKFNITKVPSLIVFGEINKDSTLKALWPKLGEIKENTFILRQIGAPYVLTSSGEVRGKIKLMMLRDNKCPECYDVTTHEIILKSLGLPTQDKEIFDINFADGKELINKYQIKLLPTIILMGDLEAYPSLKTIWLSVGTIEKDGSYVFREGVKQMGAYKDLTTNKIVKPLTNQSPNQNSNQSR